MQEITLKDGQKGLDVMVPAVMLSLERLLKAEPLAFYELVMKARNPEHQLWGDTAAILSRSGLLESGRIHEETRKIILNAVEGDEFDMHLVSPLEEATEGGATPHTK